MRGSFSIGAAVAALTFILLAGSGAAAEESDPRCIGECREAHLACDAAAHEAFRTCRNACTGADDLDGCRKECRHAFRRASRLCAEERVECRLACREDLDRECVAGCRDELALCRADLGACGDECRDAQQAKLAECRELAAGDAPPEEVRACVEEARELGRACGQTCNETVACGPELRSCVESCALER